MCNVHGGNVDDEVTRGNELNQETDLNGADEMNHQVSSRDSVMYSFPLILLYQLYVVLCCLVRNK